MSTSSQPKQTIMVLGSTGGCTLNFTIRALQEGHQVSALVRSANKLTTLLKENAVTSSELKNLTIVEGNSKNETDMVKALQINGQVVDLIESGIGARPTFKNLIPSIEDPNICENTMTTLFKALSAIRVSAPSAYKRPILIGISTTGISEYGRDLPLPMIPVYAALASQPHKDKKLMEKMIKTEGSKEDSLLSGWCIVRASFLEMGTKNVGWENLRVGVEEYGKPMPKSAIGWVISRPDVGRWIYAALVKDEAGIMRQRYLNHCVGITA